MTQPNDEYAQCIYGLCCGWRLGKLSTIDFLLDVYGLSQSWMRNTNLLDYMPDARRYREDAKLAREFEAWAEARQEA